MLNIYITDLAAYNKGLLVGKWITLPLNTVDLLIAVDEVLKEGSKACYEMLGYYESHEEHFITDYEWEDGVGSLFEVGEYEDISKLNAMLQDLEEALNKSSNHDSGYYLKQIRFLIECGIAVNIEDAITKTDDVIVYENTNLSDLAYELIEDIYGVSKLPSIISNNIDYDQIANELRLEGRYYEIDNDVYEYVG